MSDAITTPTAGKTLHINATASPSRKMGIFKMVSTEIEGLAKGKHVRIFVSSNSGAKYLSKVTLRAICAFSPAVAAALKMHNSAAGGTINDIILPASSLAAYKKILGWMKACISEGGIVAFKKQNGRGALRVYREVKGLAVVLGIGYLVSGMDRRIEAMTHAGQ